ncbi:MAG: P63C domain-containing protein [Terriglobales bacterium]
MSTDRRETTGRSKGGVARAEALPSEARQAIAKKGAIARWGAKATHKGNFQKEFGLDVECYVLDDENHTAVVSLRGLGVALGFSPGSSDRVPTFLQSARVAKYVDRELIEKLKKPVVFQGSTAIAGGPFPTAHGYDVTLLIDVCKVIVKAEAEGVLQKRHAAIAKQAHIILGASAKAGIKGLVYALSGYDATREEVIAAFKQYVQEEARKYEQEFPNDLYLQWHRLYQIPVHERGKPWQFKLLTVNHIYYPLAKSNGKILELVRALKAQGGKRRDKLFQFLNELGARALRIQIGRVLEMTESSESKADYENKIAARFGGQTELPLEDQPTSSSSSEPLPPSSLSPTALGRSAA